MSHAITSLKLDSAVIDRAEKLVPHLKKEPMLMVTNVSRSLVLRLAILEGLKVLEERTKK